MQISEEIIKVLEYLCEKLGFTIDWTSNNVLPYVEQLCEKFIRWEVCTSVAWIGIAIFAVIAAFIFAKVIGKDENIDWDGFEKVIFWIVFVVAIIVIGKQIFHIVECYTFPEKMIYEYIKDHISSK